MSNILQQKNRLVRIKIRKIDVATLAVMPSILSNMFNEFINPTVQRTVTKAFNAKYGEIGMILFELTIKTPQSICTRNLIKGLVSKASSVNPIKKEGHIPIKNKTKVALPKMFSAGCETK